MRVLFSDDRVNFLTAGATQLSFLFIPIQKNYMKCKSGLTSISEWDGWFPVPDQLSSWLPVIQWLTNVLIFMKLKWRASKGNPTQRVPAWQHTYFQNILTICEMAAQQTQWLCSRWV
jgi:hypothetical protein